MSEPDKQYFLTEEEERKVPSLQEINRRCEKIFEETPVGQTIEWSEVLFTDEEWNIGIRIQTAFEKDERREFWDKFRRPEAASAFERAISKIRLGAF